MDKSVAGECRQIEDIHNRQLPLSSSSLSFAKPNLVMNSDQGIMQTDRAIKQVDQDIKQEYQEVEQEDQGIKQEYQETTSQDQETRLKDQETKLEEQETRLKALQHANAHLVAENEMLKRANAEFGQKVIDLVTERAALASENGRNSTNGCSPFVDS